MTIIMKDYAWVWMDWDRPYLSWIVDCPDCGKLELPVIGFTNSLRNKVEHLANLHNERLHRSPAEAAQ